MEGCTPGGEARPRLWRRASHTLHGGCASMRGVQRPISLEYQIYPPSSPNIWYSSNWNGPVWSGLPASQYIKRHFTFVENSTKAFQKGHKSRQYYVLRQNSVFWVLYFGEVRAVSANEPVAPCRLQLHFFHNKIIHLGINNKFNVLISLSRNDKEVSGCIWGSAVMLEELPVPATVQENHQPWTEQFWYSIRRRNEEWGMRNEDLDRIRILMSNGWGLGILDKYKLDCTDVRKNGCECRLDKVSSCYLNVVSKCHWQVSGAVLNMSA